MKNTTVDTLDEGLTAIDIDEEASNAGCQVRRKIEDYLERRRNKDELGDFGDMITE